MSLLTVSGVSKEGDNGFVLKDISFSQRRRQKIAIAGETGAGKSTLLKIIAGLVQPDRGEVLFNDNRVEGPQEKLVPGHQDIAYLSQHFELPKFLRVEEILAYANVLPDKRATTLYEVCEISHLLKRKTDQLSGGEKQRIALAKLLITSPNLLLLDEPYSHLDIVHKNTLKMVVNNISRRLKIACILVSHDPLDTLSWADEIIVMREGKILQQAKPETIYSHPVNEYTAGLFGKYNTLTSKQSRAFYKLLNQKSVKEAIFVRPESFKLVKDKTKGIKGKVNHVNFFGSYYEIDISLSESNIVVKADVNTVKSGDTVFIALKIFPGNS